MMVAGDEAMPLYSVVVSTIPLDIMHRKYFNNQKVCLLCGIIRVQMQVGRDMFTMVNSGVISEDPV